jgi:zinc carboxypeptidase
MRIIRIVVPALVLVAALQGAVLTQSTPLAALKTRPERTEFRETSRYDDVVAFMKEAAAAAPKTIHLTTYGKTVEGRDMPLAVVGAPAATPDAVRKSGKLRVYIQGNIHAGEVEGKESAQMLLREFAQGRHADWLKAIVFMVAPIYNADGNERIKPDNRGPQNGPIEGMGQRPNAQGYDLNRDHMKLDSPEAKSLIKLMNDYDPHVAIDLHTTDGSFHAYRLTYSPPLNPNTNAALVALLREQWFPAVTRAIKEKHGWDYFYYGNVSSGGGRGRRGEGAPPAAPGQPREWRTFEHVPRFNNNYVGMRNRIAILSEAYSYLTFEDRIKATSWFLEEVLGFAQANAAKIRAVTQAADQEPLVGKTLSTSSRMHRGGMIDVLMGEVEDVKNPITGARMYLRKDVAKPEQMVDYRWFEPATTELVPSAYYVPADATAALDLLKTHGIRMRAVTAPVKGVEQFTITSTRRQNFQQHEMRLIDGKWAASDVTVPRGAMMIPMDQPLARLAFYLLEPASDDGLTNWNFWDKQLEGATTHPVLRRR